MPAAHLRRRLTGGTKRSLLDVAEEQFTAHGYAATSLDVVVSGAEVTKGALYHHFSGKQALFEAVFARVEAGATTRVRTAMDESDDPWEQARAALRAFLDVVRDPSYRRVVLQDGPAVLGHERYRQRDTLTSRELVHELAERLLAVAAPGIDDDLVDTFAAILFGAVSAAGEHVADAGPDEVEGATARVEVAIGVIIEGLRRQSEDGLLPDGAD